MPRGVHGLDRDVAKLDLVPVLHADGVIERVGVGPVGATLVRDVHLRAGVCGELAGA